MLLRRLLFGKIYTAIEHSSIQGKDSYNLLQLEYKKKAFNIINSKSFKSFEAVIDNLNKGQHIFLIVNNDKVLSKKIDGTHEFNKATSIAFPNIKLGDFSIDVLPQQTDSFVSICRTNEVDKTIKYYTENKINVIGYSLGNSIASTLLPYVEQESILTSNATVEIENNQIIGITKVSDVKNEACVINGLNISNRSVLPLAGILSYYSNNFNSQTNYKDSVETLKDSFKQKQIFSNLLKVGLGVMFVVLLVNFLFFTHYREKVSSLSNEQVINDSYKNTLVSLNDKVTRKRKLVTDISSATSSRVSFYMDQIGVSTPKSILLSQIYFQPLKKRIKESKEILIDTQTIIIAGTSNSSEEFSNWISLLENQEWIESVSVNEYGIGKKTHTAFELTLKLKG